MWKSMVLLVALASPSAFAADEGAKAMLFNARVSVAADGQATVSDLVGPQGVLAQAVATRLAGIRFVPARRDGAPVAAEARLHGRVILTPVGTDHYDVSVRDVTTRPLWKAAQAPRYPAERMRPGLDGAVEVRVRVDARGHVSDAVTVSSTHPSFEQAVRRVVTKWRFAPPSADTTVVVPIVFGEHRAKASAAVTHPFLCAPDETRPNVEGDSGCADRLEVVWTAVRREVRF